MVDRSAKVFIRLRDRQLKARLSDWQTTRLEATMARSFSDDADIVGGALSAPSRQGRPGQRDDHLGFALTGLTPVL